MSSKTSQIFAGSYVMTSDGNLQTGTDNASAGIYVFECQDEAVKDT